MGRGLFDGYFKGRMVYRIVLFKTPAIISENGKEKRIEKGTFALYTPDAHHSIQVIGNEYVDDWITFDLNQDELKLLEALQIPLNKVVLLYSISDIIHKIAFEFHDAYNPYKNDIMQLFMQLLFFRVSQQIYLQISLHSETKINREKFSYLLKIRNEIYSSPNKDYKIDALAKKSFMSKSYFQYLYKETFFQKGF